MTDKYALKLAETWARGGVCTLRADMKIEDYHKACAAALREKLAAQQNDPLTLEELRTMCMRPVLWLRDRDGDVGWRTIVRMDGHKVKTDCGECFNLDDCGETWLAYRRPPEE